MSSHGMAAVQLSASDVDRVREESRLRDYAQLARPGSEQRLIEDSIAFALARIDQNLAAFTSMYPAPSSVEGVYAPIENIEWTSGFWSGLLWLAFEASGEERYRDVALKQIASYQRRIVDQINVDHHDLGFLYTLSCVSAYKLTGNEVAKQTAFEAAELLLNRYLPIAGIIQAWGDLADPAQRGRMIIDCNLNLPLLYWASEVSGHARFAQAASRHLERAANLLVRPDGSTFHTYYLDATTGTPLHGKTHQGYSDFSCWARGQAWSIYGFALGYRHTRNEQLLRLTKRLANFYLNRLPADGICYWDLHFTSGDQPRDSSAAAIAVCGLLELASHLPMTDSDRHAYEAAAWLMMRELSLQYRTGLGTPENGLLKHAVYHMPNGVGVDESCIWGDYFYLEALLRMSRTWQPYW
jgi:hypothetical protein